MSSIATLERPDATYTLALTAFSSTPDTKAETDTPSIGQTIEGRIKAAAKLNRAAGQRGDSWALYGRETKPVWLNRTNWLTIVAAALASDEGRRLCRSKNLSPQTALLIARASARFADSSTGRGVTASNRTIGRFAAKLASRTKPYCHDVVSNARAVLAALGLAFQVERGRYLTAAERFLAAVHHDGIQTRAASTWSLTTPRRWYRKSYLPRRGPTGSETPRRSNSPNARKRAKAPSGRSSTTPGRPRPLSAQIVTAQLIQRSQSLDNGRHLGSLVDVIYELVDCERWTGRDLAALLDDDARRNPRDWPARIAHPAAFLRHRLSSLADRLAERSPSEVEADHHRDIHQEQQARRDRETIATQQRASSTHVANVMAELREKLAKRRANP